jgi:hypothetical protein
MNTRRRDKLYIQRDHCTTDRGKPSIVLTFPDTGGEGINWDTDLDGFTTSAQFCSHLSSTRLLSAWFI